MIERPTIKTTSGECKPVRRLLKITLLATLLVLSAKAGAISARSPLVSLPPGLPPSLYPFVSIQPVYDAANHGVRHLLRFDDVSRAQLLALTGDGGEGMLFIAGACDCTALGIDEFLVSERPIKDASGRYRSLNDESYKALLEMVGYPLDDDGLVNLAFAELAYVYNADLIDRFLSGAGFELLYHEGFMNSERYPGYRDTEFFLARREQQLYLAIRGTSGASDVQTSLDADWAVFPGSPGQAHRGYLDVARHIAAAISRHLVPDAKLHVTGHSMGASIGLLVTLLLAQEGIPAINHGYAPLPAIDDQLRTQFDGLVNATSYFLPGEELTQLDAGGHDRQLVGARITLPDVGTTAGAVHYVINYMKAGLVNRSATRAAWETALPDCVLVKYPCFAGEPDARLSACAITDDQCFASQRLEAFGFTTPLAAGEFRWLTHRNVRLLLNPDVSALQQDARLLRLAWLHAAQGDFTTARRLYRVSGQDAAGGFAGCIRKMVQNNATSC